MGRTVSELRACLDADELAHWMVISRTTPIGDERDDYLMAQVCLRVFQAAGIKKGRARKPRPDDWTIEDFLMFKQPTPPETDVQFLKRRLGHMVKKKGER